MFKRHSLQRIGALDAPQRFAIFNVFGCEPSQTGVARFEDVLVGVGAVASLGLLRPVAGETVIEQNGRYVAPKTNRLFGAGKTG